MDSNETYVNSAALQKYDEIVAKSISEINENLKIVADKVDSIQAFINQLNAAGQIFVVSRKPEEATEQTE